MSTEYLWYLKEQYGSKSGLTNEVLNLKDKQAAERFFSSNILKVIFDEYTQKEHQKSNNKAANNPKNFVVETENGPIELATALRYERMRANTNLIRTKGRISR
ncbi:22733_t:CDS:2 [Rhizophagus irregularis]|nr:22733_t:CDS:2 [Rhizophagus irregularis]